MSKRQIVETHDSLVHIRPVSFYKSHACVVSKIAVFINGKEPTIELSLKSPLGTESAALVFKSKAAMMTTLLSLMACIQE